MFIDGAYAAKLAERFGVWVDYDRLGAHVTRDGAARMRRLLQAEQDAPEP